jgi:hypothetical protein
MTLTPQKTLVPPSVIWVLHNAMETSAIATTIAECKTRKINPRELAFVSHYITSADPRKAYLEAGYAPSAADSQPYRLLQRPHVKAEINRRKASIEARVDFKLADALNILGGITKGEILDEYRRGPDGRVTAKVSGMNVLPPRRSLASSRARLRRGASRWRAVSTSRASSRMFRWLPWPSPSWTLLLGGRTFSTLPSISSSRWARAGRRASRTRTSRAMARGVMGCQPTMSGPQTGGNRATMASKREVDLWAT